MIPGIYGKATAHLGMSYASIASACPVGDSRTAERLNAGIVNADFGYRFAVLFAPFPVRIGVLYVIDYGPTIRSSSPEPTVGGMIQVAARHGARL